MRDPRPPPAAARPARAPRKTEAREDRAAARHRRKIKRLEEKIGALENEIEALETRLWEEALTLGAVASKNLADEKAARKEELDKLVEEWAAVSEEEYREPAARRP